MFLGRQQQMKTLRYYYKPHAYVIGFEPDQLKSFKLHV